MPFAFTGLARLLGSAPPPFRVVGPRTLLRSPERGDFPEWAALRAESKNFLVPFEPSWPSDALSRRGYRRRLRRYAQDWHGDVGYSFLLFRREDNALLGGVSLSNVRRGVAETASLGYWIGERFARQGYMTEGLRLTLGFAFDRLRLYRVEAACLPHNTASRRLLLKSGFSEEGYARKYLSINGAWQDHVLFGLLREDWVKSGAGTPKDQR
ncbi:MAG TPA: GNAT family protein [Stellaceae bacterium]|jgi:ribosomal-protein-alanine N-acetyltransferase|nr:GNAT family protein [Stellaceae bacterium]